MIDINTALQNILKAIYGKEVRQSIHDAISQINDNALEAVDLSQIRFGTDITSPTSSVTGYNEGNIYINTTTGIIWRLEGGSWTDKGHLKSIEAINGPTKDGLEDTYEIEFNDGTTHEYKVLNGKGITEIKLKESNVLTDTYTILFNDGTTQDFDVTNGKGISGIAKTSTSGLIDTYTITFSDGTTDTFIVTNGEKGKDAISIVNIVKDTISGLTTQYKILLSDGTYAPTGFSVTNGKDAVSIKDITLVNTVGTTKIYRVDLTDGTSAPTGFSITDGTSSYLHVRYSATFDGQNMVSTPTKDTPFIGMVVTNQNVAPTDPTVYKWVRFIGQNGTGTGDMLEADYVTLYPATKIVDKAAALWDGSKEIYGSDMLQKTEYATNGEPGIVDKAAELVDLKNQKIADTKVLANLSEDEDGNLLYKGNKITEVDDALDSNSENTVQNKVVTEAIEQVNERLSDIYEDGFASKNILPYPFKTTSDFPISGVASGVTYTDNGDGSISLNGTSTGIYYVGLNIGGKIFGNIGTTDIISGDGQIEVGDYVVIVSEKIDSRLLLQYRPANDWLILSANGSGQTFNNETFYPRVVKKDLEDKSYTRYADSNVELTAKLSDNVDSGFLQKNIFSLGETFVDKTAELRSNPAQRLIITKTNSNEFKCNYNNGTWSIGVLVYDGIDGTKDYAISYKVKNNTTNYNPSINKDENLSNSSRLVLDVSGGNNNTVVSSSNGFELYDVQVEKNTTVPTSYQPYAKSNVQLTEELAPLKEGQIIKREVNIKVTVGDYSSYTLEKSFSKVVAIVPRADAYLFVNSINGIGKVYNPTSSGITTVAKGVTIQVDVYYID